MNLGKTSSKRVRVADPSSSQSRKSNCVIVDNVNSAQRKTCPNEGEPSLTNFKGRNNRQSHQKNCVDASRYFGAKMGKLEEERNSSLREYLIDFQHFRLRYLPLGFLRIKDSICKKIKAEDGQNYATSMTVRVDSSEQLASLRKRRKSPSKKSKSTNTKFIDHLRTDRENIDPRARVSKNWCPEFLAKYFRERSCICPERNLAIQCKIWRYSAPEKPKIYSVGLKCDTNVVGPLKECFEVVQKNQKVNCHRRDTFSDGILRKTLYNQNLTSSVSKIHPFYSSLHLEERQQKSKGSLVTTIDRSIQCNKTEESARKLKHHRRENDKSSSCKYRHSVQGHRKKIDRENTIFPEDRRKLERQDEKRNRRKNEKIQDSGRKKLRHRRVKLNENTNADKFVDEPDKIKTISDNTSSGTVQTKCSNENDNCISVGTEKKFCDNSVHSDKNERISSREYKMSILGKDLSGCEECQTQDESGDIWYEVNTKYSDTSQNTAVISDDFLTPEQLRNDEISASTALDFSTSSFVESRRKESILMTAGMPKCRKQMLREKITESEILGDIKRRIDEDFDNSLRAEKDDMDDLSSQIRGGKSFKNIAGIEKIKEGTEENRFSEMERTEFNLNSVHSQSQDIDDANITFFSSSSFASNENQISVIEDSPVQSNQFEIRNISLSPIKSQEESVKLSYVTNFPTLCLAAGDQGRSKIMRNLRHSLSPSAGDKKCRKISRDYYTSMKEFNIEGFSPSPAPHYHKKLNNMEDYVGFSKEINAKDISAMSCSMTCFESYRKVKRRSSLIERRCSRGQKDNKSFLFRRFLSLDVLSSSIQEDSYINYKQETILFRPTVEREKFPVGRVIVLPEKVERNRKEESPSFTIKKIEEILSANDSTFKRKINEEDTECVTQRKIFSRDSSSKEDLFESADSGLLIECSQNNICVHENFSEKIFPGEIAVDRSSLPVCKIQADKSYSDESVNRQVDLAVKKFTEKLILFERKVRTKIEQLRSCRKLTKQWKTPRKVEQLSSCSFYAGLSTFHFPRISPCSSDDERFIGNRTTPSLSSVSDSEAETPRNNSNFQVSN